MEMLTIATNKPKVYRMGDRLFLGITGLATDCQTVYASNPSLCSSMILTVPPLCRVAKMEFRKNLYELKEGRSMEPRTYMNVLSNVLYEHRYLFIPSFSTLFSNRFFAFQFRFLFH